MNSCCTTLQTDVRIEIDLLCFTGEIDACSLDIGMKIDTFLLFYFNMDKLATPKNRLNIHCFRIHQINISPA